MAGCRTGCTTAYVACADEYLTVTADDTTQIGCRTSANQAAVNIQLTGCVDIDITTALNRSVCSSSQDLHPLAHMHQACHIDIAATAGGATILQCTTH